MTKPTDTFQNWKRSKLHGLKVLRKPPLQSNPSMISQLSKQRKPISLAKVNLSQPIHPSPMPPYREVK